jgi:D-glycero-alpha-D-manno-heptose-7-phosphate kinase
MIVEARAPTRVDLAGGTLDIHPIYLLEEDIWTINVAVEIPVRVRLISPRTGRAAHGGYTVVSRDLEERVSAPSLDALPLGGPLDLVCRALRHAAPPPPLTVVVSSSAPPGSGLGASSALLVALLAALDRLAGRRRSSADLVTTAWRLEAQALRTLTGRQDYLAAVSGGVNAIQFGVAPDRVVPLWRDRARHRALQARLVIAYTGRPHASGLTNWGVVRAYLDGVARTVDRLRRIAAVARRMKDALRADRFDALPALIAEEWSHRRALAPGVTTPLIERALAVGSKHGALAGKACGAGGGGCVLLFVREGAKRACEEGLSAAGFVVLPVRIAGRGLQVQKASRAV